MLTPHLVIEAQHLVSPSWWLYLVGVRKRLLTQASGVAVVPLWEYGVWRWAEPCHMAYCHLDWLPRQGGWRSSSGSVNRQVTYNAGKSKEKKDFYWVSWLCSEKVSIWSAPGKQSLPPWRGQWPLTNEYSRPNTIISIHFRDGKGRHGKVTPGTLAVRCPLDLWLLTQIWPSNSWSLLVGTFPLPATGLQGREPPCTQLGSPLPNPRPSGHPVYLEPYLGPSANAGMQVPSCILEGLLPGCLVEQDKGSFKALSALDPVVRSVDVLVWWPPCHSMTWLYGECHVNRW